MGQGELIRIWENHVESKFADYQISKYYQETKLAYDSKTKIIYWYFETYMVSGRPGFMSPYISENGKLCRFIDNKIVEI